MSKPFSKEIVYDNIRFIFTFEAQKAEVLNDELFYIVTCNGYEPFIMSYDFEKPFGLKIQGIAPYFAHELEAQLSDAIDEHNFF